MPRITNYRELEKSIKDKNFHPVYLLDGEEPYYIDLLIQFFEEDILSPEERDFNLITLYGKDTSWQEVVNAARRFPMFSERMVVILKEASQMKGLAELENYILNPSPTTVLVIEHRFKKLDGRMKMVKLIEDSGIRFLSEKINDSRISEWIIQFGKSKNINIEAKEAEMLSVYLGNDLQKISNEIEKIKINEPNLISLNAELIEKYIGISREYNIMDLPDVLFRADRNRLARMIAYFNSMPKAAPMPLVIGTFYSYINKVFLCFYTQQNFTTDRKLGIWPQHRSASAHIQLPQIHRIIMLLEEYSSKSVGINYNGASENLLKEMVAKMSVLLYIA